MQNYRLPKESTHGYISDLVEGKDDTLEIVFADGSKFVGIECCDENIKKINKIQENQAKEGLDNYMIFKSREGRFKKLMFISGGAVATGASMIVSTMCSSNMMTGSTPIISIGGFGVITLLSMVPAYCKFRKDHARVMELDKIKYRDSYMDVLKKYKDYPNALCGLSEDAKDYFENTDDALSMVNIDEFTLEDLKTIKTNISLEEDLGLSYKKKL